MNIIGADETGVGDYMAPLVACAAFIKYEDAIELEKTGITDSKKLSEKQIYFFASKIKKVATYKIKYLSQKGYNTLNKSFNANELKMFVHMGAINNVEEQVSGDLIILDQFSTEASIKKYYSRLGKDDYFKFKQFKAKLKLVERGEMEHVAVAAASILAREFLLNHMKEQELKWGMKFPLGTNKIVEGVAINFVAKHGIDNLKEVAKISFKTTEKLFGGNND